MRKTLFFPAKHKRLARIISISTPTKFRHSVKILKRGGLTTLEKRGLVLARNRAAAMLKRKNLSVKERGQLKAIVNVRI